jgi:hypothetical protein
LGSAVYLGWAFIGVLIVGAVAFWRDKKVWFFAFLLLLCVVLSIGPTHREWVPERVLSKLPVIENIAVQRFMSVGYLAAAVLLALILFHVHELAPDWRGWLGALAVSAVALFQMVAVFAPQLPYVMTRVTVPRWYATVAPNLPPGRVLLSYPAFSGIQESMSWQAVGRMHYSQVGGGGPEDQVSLAGSAARGFTFLGNLSFPVGVPIPTGTATEYAAVRHALKVWGVTTVVVATNPAVPALQQGHDPTYAAAFMTGALGRLPSLEAGAWVWNDVQADTRPPLHLGRNTISDCVTQAEGPRGRIVASLRAPVCVGLHGLGASATAVRAP